MDKIFPSAPHAKGYCLRFDQGKKSKVRRAKNRPSISPPPPASQSAVARAECTYRTWMMTGKKVLFLGNGRAILPPNVCTHCVYGGGGGRREFQFGTHFLGSCDTIRSHNGFFLLFSEIALGATLVSPPPEHLQSLFPLAAAMSGPAKYWHPPPPLIPLI